MSSEALGALSVIKKEQPLAEYTHCRNYILNLAISYACKNQSIKKIYGQKRRTFLKQSGKKS